MKCEGSLRSIHAESMDSKRNVGLLWLTLRYDTSATKTSLNRLLLSIVMGILSVS